jgi:hypothetical protein
LKPVNPFFLSTLIGPLIGLADDDEVAARYKDLDPDDEASVRAIIRELLVPYYATLGPLTKERARVALNYYLCKPSISFQRVLDSNLIPFDAPKDARLFFFWLWQELFPNEELDRSVLAETEEVHDIDEPHRLAADEYKNRSVP